MISHLEFTNLIVLGESIIVKDRENQCLVKGFTIRYLEITKGVSNHTVILEYFNIKEYALSNFAFQSF